MRAHLAVLLLFSSIATYALAAPPPDFPEAKAFLETAVSHWEAQETRGRGNVRALPVAGATSFVSIGALIRGQKEISVDNIREKKFSKGLADNDFSWDAKHDQWIFHHDRGRSSISLNDPISVIKGPQGFVIIDGHHDFYLALFLGAQTVAVNVKEDLSGLSPTEFWTTLKARNLVYLDESAESLAQSPPRTEVIQDNPNRYLATLLALKVKASFDSGTVEIVKVKGAKVPVWIKVNDSIPFVEFYVAKALTDAGIHYNPDWGKHVPSKIVEKARAIVWKKHQSRNSELEKVPVLKNPEIAALAYEDPVVLKGILSPLSVSACGEVFSAAF